MSSKEKAADARLRREYGLTLAEYNQLLDFQGRRCAICKRPMGRTRLAVDHSHKDGLLRGLLCWKCNHHLLGAFADSLKLLLAAIAYLQSPPMTVVFGKPRYTAPGKVGTKRRRKLLKLMKGSSGQ